MDEEDTKVAEFIGELLKQGASNARALTLEEIKELGIVPPEGFSKNARWIVVDEDEYEVKDEHN